jgi:PAP2 superfamily protein
LHFFWEPALQRYLGQGLLQIQIWNAIYFWAHAPVIAVVGIWLYMRSRRDYSLIRNAFLGSAVLGLLIYYAYPVAPPRLLPGFGFVDTLQRYSSLSYQAQSLRPFVNPYAAVPSLHFGWSVLIGVGLIRMLRGPIGWALGSILPLLMLVAIIATANHFVFDAVIGLVVCLVSLGAALAFQHWQLARQAVLNARARPQVREPAAA